MAAAELLMNAAVQLAPWLTTGVVAYNARKAFGRLCTAGTDLLVAKVESVTSETKAATAGRTHLTEALAEKLAAKFDVNAEYVRAAEQRAVEKLIGKQLNLDKIAAVAARELADAAHQSATDGAPSAADAGGTPPAADEAGPATGEISDDFLNTFEEQAGARSTEEMQALFGKILAGEIRRPSTYSIRTLKLLGQLDQRVAAVFQRACSLSISLQGDDHIFDARVPSLGGNANHNALQQFGLGFEQCNALHEAGLIIADFHSYMRYEPAVAHDGRISLPLVYAETPWALMPKSPGERPELRVHGVALSGSGRELLRVVRLESNDGFTEALRAYFAGLGYELRPVAVRAGGR